MPMSAGFRNHREETALARSAPLAAHLPEAVRKGDQPCDTTKPEDDSRTHTRMHARTDAPRHEKTVGMHEKMQIIIRMYFKGL